MTNAPVTNARTDRFFDFPVTILIFASFMLGMSEFVVVGILPDIASGLKISEVTVAIWWRCSPSYMHHVRRSARHCPHDSLVLPPI